MRRSLPFLLIGAWFLVDGALALGKSISPSLIAGVWPERAGAILAGALLALAVSVAIASAVRGEQRWQSAAAMAVAVALECGSTGFYLWAASEDEQIAAPFKSGLTVEKLADRALSSPAERGRELAARYAFGEYGVRIQYADGSGEVRAFEPNTADIEQRQRNRQLQADIANTQEVLRRQAIGFRWVALASLLSFAAVFVGGAILVGWPRRRHGRVESR